MMAQTIITILSYIVFYGVLFVVLWLVWQIWKYARVRNEVEARALGLLSDIAAKNAALAKESAETVHKLADVLRSEHPGGQ